MVDGADISTLKNLAASSDGKAFGIAFIIGLTAIIAFHFKMQRFGRINIRRKQHTLAVRVYPAHIFTVYLNADFSRGFKRKPKLLPLHFLGNINIGGDESGAVRCEIHIAPIERARRLGVKFIFVFRDLARVFNL